MTRPPFSAVLAAHVHLRLLAAPPARKEPVDGEARAWQTHLQNRYESLVFDVAIGGDGW